MRASRLHTPAILLASALLASPAAAQVITPLPADGRLAEGALIRIQAPALREMSVEVRPLPTTWVGSFVRADSTSIVVRTPSGEHGIPWNFVQSVEAATGRAPRTGATTRWSIVGAGTGALLGMFLSGPLGDNPGGTDETPRTKYVGAGAVLGALLGGAWGYTHGGVQWTHVDRGLLGAR